MSDMEAVFTNASKEIFSKIGYELILSGIVDYGMWSRALKDNIIARFNIADNFESDVDRFVNEIWMSEYRNEKNESKLMAIWAEIVLLNVNRNYVTQNKIDRLFRAMKAYRNGGFYKQLTNFVAHFKEMGPYNSMLVKVQMPEAKYVLTEKEWLRRYNRVLSVNARPLVILRLYGPIDFVYEISDTQKKDDSSDTEKDKLLEEIANPNPVYGKISNEKYFNLLDSLDNYGIIVENKFASSGYYANIRTHKRPYTIMLSNGKDRVKIKTNSYYLISVNAKSSKEQTFASICHELGHLFCYHLMPPVGTDWWTFRYLTSEQQEFEAEIVSYIICERYGIENQSWKYLSKWFDEDTEIPDISTERIFKATEEIFKMIEGKSIASSFMYKSNKQFQKAAKSLGLVREEKKKSSNT